MRFQRSLEAILLDSRAEQVARPGNRIASQREAEIGRVRAEVAQAASVERELVRLPSKEARRMMLSAAQRRELRTQRRELIRELRRQGEERRVIARRLGITERQVRAIEEYPL